MAAETAIEVRGLWKRYGLPMPRLISRMAGLITRASERTDTLPWALQDISFTLRRGENLGIIGRNGAGKSTLLKVLAGVSPATKGELEVRGRVFPMIELQAGTNPNLTGRENIMLLGAVMGFSPREIRGRYDEIAEFSELGSWLERPVRMYSSGMQARLAFSVAVHADAEILLVDEILGVGDYKFQKKCIERLEMLRLSAETSLIFVSHNPYQIQRLCDRVMLLESGVRRELTEASRALELYFQSAPPVIASGAGKCGIKLPSPEIREGSGAFRVTRIEQLDASQSAVSAFRTGAGAVLRLHFATTEPVPNPNFGIRIYDSQNTCLLSFAFSRQMSGKEFSGEGYIDCRMNSMPLVHGDYAIQVKVSGQELYDFIQSAPGMKVESDASILTDTAGYGLFYQQADWVAVDGTRKDNSRV